jgi:SEC-C motif-containing protein
MTAPVSTSSLPSNAPCPCGSGRSFGLCCEPILKQERAPATAEELMRSRYTAHVIGDNRHLHRTFLGTMRKPYVEEPDTMKLDWTRLVVHAHEVGPGPAQATVDFSAYYRDGEAERAIHEKSEFKQIDGGWIYTRTLRNGPAPMKSAEPKVGRNDPCPCGSGKKFKHCCGR